jgi:dimethylhistidine N-methyltransferase
MTMTASRSTTTVMLADAGAGRTAAHSPDLEVFRAAVIEGLSGPTRRIPSKWLYDTTGSRLFEAICDTEDYYVARAETTLLTAHAAEIAALAGPRVLLAELGSGACAKVRALLDALEAPAGYVPIDISSEQLADAAARLRRTYPQLRVQPLRADYSRDFAIPAIPGAARRMGFFPGSTACNMVPPEMLAFLRRLGGMLGEGSLLLLGVDVKKDEARLLRAYNGAQGLFAAFNLNMLTRINRELDGDFDLAAFRHEARYAAGPGRIEVYLVARDDCAFQAAGRTFRFVRGETIHMENSYKYSVEEFQALAGQVGWSPLRAWSDELFSIHLLQRAAAGASAA